VKHLTIALSEGTVRSLFAVLRDNFSWHTGPTTFDVFNYSGTKVSLGYEIGIQLENGTVDLRPDNTIAVSELDIKWKTLTFTIGLDIPQKCFGGWCVAWVPVKGCVAHLPKICAFSKDPDIKVSLDLSGLVTSEVSVTILPKVTYAENHLPTTSYLDAQDQGNANKWQVHAFPQTVDVDAIDVSDTVGDLLMTKLTDAIIQNALIGPSWAKKLEQAFLGPIDQFIRDALDLPDDIQEWFSDLLNVSLGIGDWIIQAILIYLSNEHPLFEIEDPYPILKATISSIPVKIPIEKEPSVTVTDDELIVEANVGN
jgi:hypothetical protein